nr:cache domain-containing protein [Shewanella halifaxensis]
MFSWLEDKRRIIIANEDRISRGHDSDRELLLTINGGGFIDVYAGFDTGDIISGDKTQSWPEDYDPRTRPWYKLAYNSNEMIATPPYIDISGAPVVTLAQRFNGVMNGVLAADLSISYITEQINNLNIDNAGFAFLLDENNKIWGIRKKACTLMHNTVMITACSIRKRVCI